MPTAPAAARSHSLLRRLAAVPLAAAVVALAGCGQGGLPKTARDTAAGYPVTVISCAQPVTFEAAPRRAVANDINIVEMMLALGLADRMAGIAGVGGRDEVLPELRDDFKRVNRLSDQYISLEPLLGAEPDFFFAGWNYGFSQADGLTPDTLAPRGVKSYVLSESCAHVVPSKPATSVEETFTDLRNLGIIFGERRQAEKLIADQRRVLDDVARRVGRSPAVPVFVYDSGEDSPFTAPGLAIPTDLIRRAGGKNIFGDLAETWTTVSWEQVVERDPDCVLIVDYGDVTWQHKRQFMTTNPAFSGLSAVRKDCFLALPYAALTPGIRNGESVRAIARLLHPEAFAG